MATDFAKSKTRENLMRAFVGESQARNRYTFAASQARASNLAAIAAVFTFTAEQEKEHAQIFYGLLRACSGENIRIDGAYPVDLSDSVTQLLRFAQHNEAEEYDPVYRVFGKTAKEEVFEITASSEFRQDDCIEEDRIETESIKKEDSNG